ncbi:Pam17-domain-containing protein [Lepidopterella palustris CBS 459.81]|uniref:Presequence translocated-associated motor subunit PAM17 n=1 Tax=Lepidopterella palustris CBS 459.81 TaxID=1314670 RepID=A0A8E2E336_9PEZI|nr:Pam17-domain-containing protein [Lepidopterella palustris CBS 459.81]
MLSTTTLRSTRAITLRIQPTFLAPCAGAASYTTSVASPAKTAPRPCTPRRAVLPLSAISHTFARAASSTTTPSTPSTTTTSSSPSTTQPLTWNRFLALRRTRRRISVLASLITSAASMAGGVSFLLARDFDSVGAQTLGLDPIVVLGLGTIGFAAAGWLLGPVFGGVVFRGIYRKVGGEVAEKERAFYARIKKYRVDPSSSSMANPVPDYYGEKIGSVADYRRWLKDQRAFNLKKGSYGGSGKV